MTTTYKAKPVTPSSSVALILPDASASTLPMSRPRPASPCADQHRGVAQFPPVGASLDPGHKRAVTHVVGAGVDLGPVQSRSDAQISCDRLNLASADLQFAAAFLDDVERVRISTENRIRALEQEGIPAEPYRPQLAALQAVEHQATLSLQHAVRKHPLGAWIKRTIGVGEKQGARLVAAIDSVSYNHAADRPRRGPAELWAYCGFAPDQKRRKGVKSNWNADAKMRAFLVAESCIKQMHSPYRADYDRARTSWADRDTSDWHKHNHALRVVAKAVLRDLFLEARQVGA